MLASSVTARPLRERHRQRGPRRAMNRRVDHLETLRAATLRANAATAGFASNAMTLPAVTCILGRICRSTRRHRAAVVPGSTR